MPAWDKAATISASPARNRPRPASMTGRLGNRASRSWVTAPTASSKNTTAPCTAWLFSCSTSPRKVGTSAVNSPSREKAANAAAPAATNSLSALLGDAEAGEAQ